MVWYQYPTGRRCHSLCVSVTVTVTVTVTVAVALLLRVGLSFAVRTRQSLLLVAFVVVSEYYKMQYFDDLIWLSLLLLLLPRL